MFRTGIRWGSKQLSTYDRAVTDMLRPDLRTGVDNPFGVMVIGDPENNFRLKLLLPMCRKVRVKYFTPHSSQK